MDAGSAGQTIFSARTFRGAGAAARHARWLSNLPCGALGEDKEREGKGRDACRDSRREENPNADKQAHASTSVPNEKKGFRSGVHGTVRSNILMVQQFLKIIMESLILAQNERWRRG